MRHAHCSRAKLRGNGPACHQENPGPWLYLQVDKNACGAQVLFNIENYKLLLKRILK